MSGYIGTQPVPQATQTRDSFTATSNQTSFATSGYTPNFLDVFLNGVKLAAADYTASNGSDVVLATGATTGDILEVVAYTNFDTANVTGAANFTVTGSFTSQGIDDNANATAITIDSSENVLVGKTSAGAASTGFESRSSGYTAITRDGGQPLEVRRLASDGVLIDLRKDSATVGTIGVISSNNLIIANPTSNHSGVVFGTNTILPAIEDDYADGLVDLGNTSERWRDLYLSGGVFLGGTGAANKLEDAEQGTYTVAITTGSMTTNTVGAYTKLGSLVHFTFVVSNFTDSSSGNAVEFSLPFSAVNSAAVSCGFVNSGISLVLQGGYISSASGKIRFYAPEGTANAYRVMIHSDFLHTNCVMHVSGTYRSTV